MRLNKINEINEIEQDISFIFVHHWPGQGIEWKFLLNEREQYFLDLAR
jgi:hypothetical protein